MKLFKRILLAILILLIVISVAWFVLYYVIWPKPNLHKLIPDKPFAYIAASNLAKTVEDNSVSEFINRFFISPSWESFKSTATGQRIVSQKVNWEKNLGRPIDTDTVMGIVGKDSALAFFNDNGRWDFLLVSQLGMLMRFGMASGLAKGSLASGYKIVEEKYKGINVTTLEGMNEKYCYGFIGRAGMLTTDISILKKAIDAYKDKDQRFVEKPEFRKLTAGLSGMNLSFYVDTSRINEVYTTSGNPVSIGVKPSRTRYLLSLAGQFDASASFMNQELGNLKFDSRLQNGKTENQKSDEQVNSVGLFAPEDSIFFLQNKDMKPETIFEMTKGLLGLDLDVIKYLLLPSIGNGVSLTALAPKIQEFQLSPPLITVFTIKNRDALESALTIIRKSLVFRNSRLEFSPTEYEGVTSFHTNLTTRGGLILEPGYAVINDYLIIATYRSALKTAIDVYKGKQQPIVNDQDYSSIIKSIMPVSSTDGNIFLDIKSLSSITKQAAKMYGIQAKLMGVKSAELSATRMYENANLWEVWHYMGATFHLEDGKTDVKLVLNSE